MNVRLGKNVFDTDKISAIAHILHFMGRDEEWIDIGFQGGTSQRYPLSDPEVADFYEWYLEQAGQPWRFALPKGFIENGESVFEAIQRHLQDAGVFDTRIDYHTYDLATNSTRYLLSYGDGTTEDAIKAALPRRVLYNIDFAYIGTPEGDERAAEEGAGHSCISCGFPAHYKVRDGIWVCINHVIKGVS